MKSLVIAALVAAIVSPAGASAQTAPKIPVEAFAAGETFSGPTISPSGTRVLAKTIRGDSRSLSVASLTDDTLIEIALPSKNDLVGYRWAGDDRILFWVGDRMPVFTEQDAYVTRTFAYDLQTQKLTKVGPRVMGINGSDILWVSPTGDRLLMAVQTSPYEYNSVFKVDLAKGSAAIVQTPYESTSDWFADRNGNVRAGFTSLENSWALKYRPTGSGGYISSPKTPYRQTSAQSFYMPQIEGSSVGYVKIVRNGFVALHEFDFATFTVGKEIFAKAGADVSEPIFDNANGALLGVAYEDDTEHDVWFDKARKELAEGLGYTFNGRTVNAVSRSDDGNREILWVGGAADPGEYYVFSHDSGQISRLSKLSPDIDRKALSKPKPIHYRSRDGLDIPAYLTLPVGRAPKNLPLVIVPHGGPYGVRDSLAYDDEVQFLANRGYAVLQPNYRGSDGFGEAFAEAGDGEWGRRMQDDVDDGMDYLAKEGIIDPKRTCIVGGSYGGYVALWGAVRNPERYRCAVSFAGISNLKQQLGYQRNFFWSHLAKSDWQQKVQGTKDIDLIDYSPIARAATASVPIMLVHGDEDKVVPISQSEQFAKALNAAGKTVEYYVYPGAGHGFDKPSDEASYLRRLEAFLTKYNPAG